MNFIKLSIFAAAVVLLAGCSTLQLPDNNLGEFSNKYKADLVIKPKLIDWITVPDAHAYCSAYLEKIGEPIPAGIIGGCAIVDEQINRCKVITSIETTYAIFGHEMRHCFDGFYH
jgi:hypothetical protein